MALDLNKKLNEILNNINISNKPNLFLHVCCGPCSTAVLEKLKNYFNIFIIFFNSNIDTYDEFRLRLLQLNKVIDYFHNTSNIIYNEYNHDDFLSYVKGYEKEHEGGERCNKCFEFRLKKSYDIAIDFIKKNSLLNYKNYLCSTLSISPHKNASKIEEIGEKICKDSLYIEYLPSDFKKEDGFLKSIKISKSINLYRQNYCGCEFSKCIN